MATEIVHEGKRFEVVSRRHVFKGELFLSATGCPQVWADSAPTDEKWHILRPLEQAPEAKPEQQTSAHLAMVDIRKQLHAFGMGEFLIDDVMDVFISAGWRPQAPAPEASEKAHAPQPLQLRVGYRYESEKGGVVEIVEGPDEEDDFVNKYHTGLWKANGWPSVPDGDTVKNFGCLLREIGPAAPEAVTLGDADKVKSPDDVKHLLADLRSNYTFSPGDTARLWDAIKWLEDRMSKPVSAAPEERASYVINLVGHRCEYCGSLDYHWHELDKGSGHPIAKEEQPTPTPEPRETLWDKYAMAALNAMGLRQWLDKPEHLVRKAFEYADSAMAERQKRGVK